MNLVGLQLIIGFAQVAQNKEVQKYFVEGMELSKKIEIDLGGFLRESF